MKLPMPNEAEDTEPPCWTTGNGPILYKVEDCYVFEDRGIDGEQVYWDFTPWGLFQLLSVLDQAGNFMDGPTMGPAVDQKTWRINGCW